MMFMTTATALGWRVCLKLGRSSAMCVVASSAPHQSTFMSLSVCVSGTSRMRNYRHTNDVHSQPSLTWCSSLVSHQSSVLHTERCFYYWTQERVPIATNVLVLDHNTLLLLVPFLIFWKVKVWVPTKKVEYTYRCKIMYWYIATLCIFCYPTDGQREEGDWVLFLRAMRPRRTRGSWLNTFSKGQLGHTAQKGPSDNNQMVFKVFVCIHYRYYNFSWYFQLGIKQWLMINKQIMPIWMHGDNLAGVILCSGSDMKTSSRSCCVAYSCDRDSGH